MRKIKNICFCIRWVPLYLMMIIFLCSCADLVVQNIHSEPFIGHSRMIKATVKNKGLMPAPASKTRVEKTADLSVPYTQAATIATPLINGGEEKELPILPDPGICIHLRVCADINDDVEECQTGEENNCTTKSIGCP